MKRFFELFPESEFLEYKEKASPFIVNTIVAFLNSEGGRIVFGVSLSENRVVGVLDTEKTINEINYYCKDIEPSPYDLVKFDIIEFNSKKNSCR